MQKKDLSQLKSEIRLEAKNGVDFILAATIVWSLITYVWTLDFTAYNLSVITFMVGGIMLPLAFGLSKVLKTNWKIKDNPLDSLGLWLNFAQLIYFPFLIFTLLRFPDYFIMTYAIITGAHLFPYAWFYDEIGYAIWAVVISLGSMLIALNITIDQTWLIPLFTAAMLLSLAGWIWVRRTRRVN